MKALNEQVDIRMADLIKEKNCLKCLIKTT